MVTTVVNLKEEPFDIYIGRPSLFGNPFYIGRDGTREECIEKFKGFFYSNMNLMRATKEKLSGKVLGCYCKPLPCHGDIIAEYLNGLEKDEKRTASS